LKALLDRNSGNSSQPPSADKPSERAKRPTPPPTGRKPGGQPGHRGTTRRLFPAEAVTTTIELAPQQCACCNKPLPADTPVSAAPRLHHVGDLPPTQLQVTEYQLQGRTCGCGHETWAELPAGVPLSNWGPGVQALAVALTGYFRLSRRRTAAFLESLLGYAPSVGTLVSFEAAAVAALQPALTEVQQEVATAGVVNIDETGWRRGKERPALWVVVTPRAVLFHLGRRDKKAFQRLLPRWDRRIVGSDRYVVYEGVEIAFRQLCWAHLKRAFQALAESAQALPRTVGHWALAQLRELFRLWHEFRERRWTRVELLLKAEPVKAAFRALLNMGQGSEDRATRNLCKSLLERWDGLWTFLSEPGVEPTNNAAERALRTAVLWRKCSFGHKSDGGGAYVEALLTVGGTLTLQKRGLLPFLQEVFRATVAGRPAPKLLAPT
jgi:transposase